MTRKAFTPSPTLYWKWWWLLSCYIECVCAQWCPAVCDPMDCSLPGSSVHGIIPERILEWVAISSSRGSSWPRGQTHISCISCAVGRFFTTSDTWEALVILNTRTYFLIFFPRINSLILSKIFSECLLCAGNMQDAGRCKE